MKHPGGADDVVVSDESGRHRQEWANDSNAGQASTPSAVIYWGLFWTIFRLLLANQITPGLLNEW